jgi:hypothetical protein
MLYEVTDPVQSVIRLSDLVRLQIPHFIGISGKIAGKRGLLATGRY